MMKMLPCPFCGGEAHVSARDDGFGNLWFTVTCDPAKSCYGSLSRVMYSSDEEAVEAWNNRHQHAFHDDFYDCDSTTNASIPLDPGEASLASVDAFIQELYLRNAQTYASDYKIQDCGTSDAEDVPQIGLSDMDGSVDTKDAETQAADQAFDEQGYEDSREKLEADVKASYGNLTIYVRPSIVLGWLDRQAAITEREVKAKVNELRKRVKDQEEKLDEYERLEFVVPLEDAMKYSSDPPKYVKAQMQKLQMRVGELEAELRARDDYPEGFMSNGEMLERIWKAEAERDMFEELWLDECWHAGHQRMEIANLHAELQGIAKPNKSSHPVGRDGRLIRRGEILYGEDGRGWLAWRFDGKYIWDREGKRLKPEWLSHEKPKGFSAVVLDEVDVLRQWARKDSSWDLLGDSTRAVIDKGEISDMADRLEKGASECSE